jgi:tRNA A37 threonylcarbamoyltransferase TsaD
VYYSGSERAERKAAIMVHKSMVRSTVKKIACNILLVQVYMLVPMFEANEVEELHNIIEEILEEDGKRETNIIIISHCGGPGSIPGVHVGFVVDKVAMGQIFLRVVGFPLSISFHCAPLLVKLGKKYCSSSSSS